MSAADAALFALQILAAGFLALCAMWALLIVGWIVAVHVERARMHRRGEDVR